MLVFTNEIVRQVLDGGTVSYFVRLLCHAGYARHPRDPVAALAVTAAALCDVFRAWPSAVLVRDLAQQVTFPFARDDAHAAALRLLVQRTLEAERHGELVTFRLEDVVPLTSLRNMGTQPLLDAKKAIQGVARPSTDIVAADRVWRARGVVCPIWAGELAVDLEGP